MKVWERPAGPSQLRSARSRLRRPSRWADKPGQTRWKPTRSSGSRRASALDAVTGSALACDTDRNRTHVVSLTHHSRDSANRTVITWAYRSPLWSRTGCRAGQEAVSVRHRVHRFDVALRAGKPPALANAGWPVLQLLVVGIGACGGADT